MDALTKRYLGDGVYATLDGRAVVLTTENGIRSTNTIYLEPEVQRALVDFMNRIDEPTRPFK